MQAFRDLVRGWLGKSLLALLMVPFAIVGIESYFVGGKASPAATVNDEDISQTELDRSVDQQKQRLLASMGENPDATLIDGPVLRQATAGARLLLNLNGSPFHHDKIVHREKMLRDRAVAAGAPIVYVNQVGGQDELVFDGGSLLVDADGLVAVVTDRHPAAEAQGCAGGVHRRVGEFAFSERGREAGGHEEHIPLPQWQAEMFGQGFDHLA